jgi:hypothetical protein
MREVLRRAGLLAFCAVVLSFALLGLVMLVATGVMLLKVLTGNGPEQAENALVVVVGFPMSLVGFLGLSLPGFLYVATTLNAAFRPRCERCEDRRRSGKQPTKRMSTWK